MKKLLTIFSFFLILGISYTSAQGQKIVSIESIQSLLNEDKLEEANQLVDSKIQDFTKNQQYDSLSRYSYLYGKINGLIEDKVHGVEKIEYLSDLIVKNSTNKLTLYHTYFNLGIFYSENGEMPLAYENINKSKTHLNKFSPENLQLDAEYYSADFSMKMGDFNLFENHIRESNKMIEKSPEKELRMTAKVYNLMGGLMFFSSKSDSAFYYFEKALDNIKNLEQSPKNSYYLPAAIKGNMVMLKQNEGKFEEAIILEKESNRLNSEFLKKFKNHPLTTNVKRNISIGYLGLGSLYSDLGDYENAEKFSLLLYNFAKENFDSNTQEYFTALLNHAEINLFRKEFVKAQHYLTEAQKCLKTIPGDNLQLNAHINGVFGNLYYKLGDFDNSKKYFLLSRDFYEKAHEGVYSRDRLYQLMNLAIITSLMNEKELAIELAHEAYDNYTYRNDPNDQLTIACIQALASVYYDVQEYEKSLEWSEKALVKYNTKVGLNTTQDKAAFDILKAKTIQLHAKARYALKDTKDEAFVREIIAEINQAVSVFENRKSIVSSIADVNTALDDNRDVFDFLKNLHIELYHLTNDPNDLYKLISLNESGLYNRIRIRLNIRDQISFKGVSESTLQREKELRKNLNEYLYNDEMGDDEMDDLLTLNGEWISFLDSLKTSNAKYHKMRYASIEKPIGDIKENIPNNTTVIRYLFIEDSLYVFVIDSQNESLLPLNSDGLMEEIELINDFKTNVQDFSIHHQLYRRIWQPIADKITTDNVIIIPDGPLFNISFESLTDTNIQNPNEFVSHSLLSKHCISYNYSLFLLDQKKNETPFSNNFIAFAPEFTDQMKEDYKFTLEDSLEVDKTYLNLLPQPFSSEMVKSYANLFDGSSFVNQKSTETIFKNNAKEHKIIHIGTHAESNNFSPELSRLIFAKNVSDSSSVDDNSLYTYEIYDCNLACNLAILTACETGKPTFQPGEGMISLAHAFNYAGSESMLTSLWKIDEHSSTKIIEYFYENISEGMTKDEALRKAKLKFLSLSEGRIKNPQYWAGLVLIGDTSPIDIQLNSNNNNTWVFLMVGFLCLLILYFLFLKKRKRI